MVEGSKFPNPSIFFDQNHNSVARGKPSSQKPYQSWSLRAVRESIF